jgi:hypothetical protein
MRALLVGDAYEAVARAPICRSAFPSVKRRAPNHRGRCSVLDCWSLGQPLVTKATTA